MFGKKGIIALLVGTEKLSLVSFEISRNAFFPQITGMLEQKYSGFQDGEFLRVEELYPTIKKLIDNFYIRFNKKVKRLYIAVPGEFSCAVSKNVERDIDKRIKEEDLEEMFFIGDTYSAHQKFVNIERSGVFYKTDCNPRKLLNPVGQSCNRVLAKLSYILAERYFIDIFNEIAARLNIKVKYISSIFSEVGYVNKLKSIKELSDTLYLNLGYLSSTLSYSMGKGILNMTSFSLGGGTVAGDITIVMNIPFSHSYELYNKLNLNIQPEQDQVYSIFVDGENFCYDIKTINAIAEERIFDIAGYIKSAIEGFDIDIEDNVPLYMGGSAICRLPGVREIIENVCARPVETIMTDYTGWEATENLSVISVLNYFYNKQINKR